MQELSAPGANRRFFALQAAFCAIFLVCIGSGCRSGSPATIAFIPRTSGTLLWEPAHIGAEIAAHKIQTKVYWNAPTREDDVQGQIALLERVIDRSYVGIVLAPDQALALISPVRRALSKGIPTVVIGSPLAIPPGGKLTYILNDDEQAGKMAAARIARLLHGKGLVAILGIDPDITGVMIRGRSLERALTQNYPEIRIVEKHMGSFNVPYEQQIAEETLRENPNLNAIVALTSASTRGACSALARIHQIHPVKLVGFDDPDIRGPLHNDKLDSLIVQNSPEMGRRAIEAIAAQLQGKSVPPEIKLRPTLVTRENVDSAEVREIHSIVWRTEP
jgi:ribose transport system substrate-binding protein